MKEGKTMLTGKQKSFLRAQAHEMQPIVQVGKNLVTEAIIETILKALEARELIKISVLQNCLAEPTEISEMIAEHADAQIVQVIGRVIILYKRSTKPANRIITNQIPR